MNASFITLGFTTGLGALLLRPRLLPGPFGLIATSLFIASGIGIAMVGLNPENLQIVRHIIGAYLNAYGAALAIVFTGFCLKNNIMHSKAGVSCIFVGLLLLCLILMYTIGFYHNIPIFSLGLGDGGMEKLCNYSAFLWLIFMGFYFMLNKSFN
jgi:hypothetical protein